MFSGKMHFFIESLDACHVGFRIISKFHFMTAAHPFCAPVEISHIYGTSHLTGDSVESGLPAFYRLAGTLRCKSKMYHRGLLHLVDDAEGDIAASFPVNRDSAHLAQKPSEWAPEKLTFNHTVRLAADRCIIKV